MDFKKITDNIISKYFNEPIAVQIENERLHISYEYTTYYTIWINKEYDTFKIFNYMDKNGIDISDEHSFEVYFDAICISIKKEILKFYKKGHHKTLPFQSDEIKEIGDISITAEEFIDIFYDITEDVSNGEEAFDVNIDLTKRTIDFSVDCGRYGKHEDNYISINKYGVVKVRLCEYLESGGIASELEDMLTKKFNGN